MGGGKTTRLRKVKYKIEFEQGADTDLTEIVDWYRDQREGLEIDFVSSLKSTLDFIVSNPSQYQERFRGVRTARTLKFPYLVFYRVASSTIAILGIIHTSRNPRLIRKRIKK